MRYGHCRDVLTRPTARLTHKRLVARRTSGGLVFMREKRNMERVVHPFPGKYSV